MFQVLDNGKPAEMELCTLWANSIFQHFNHARTYAKRWLGPVAEDCVPDRPDEKIDYSGCGDTIEIKSL